MYIYIYKSINTSINRSINICIYMYIYSCTLKYLFRLIWIHRKDIYIWVLIKIPLSGIGHFSRIKMLLSRNFREVK